MAEEVGFEPTEPFGSPVFKTGAIDHSATPPNCFFFSYLFRKAFNRILKILAKNLPKSAIEYI